MAIPALDVHGLLPVGCHDCTWDEIKASFCWNAHRTGLFDKAQDFLDQVWRPLNIDAPFLIDGSFTRKKDVPDDIDLVADVSHLSNADAMPVVNLWFQNAHLKNQFKIDFWFKHPIYPHDLTAFFCYTGLKAGAELGLDTKHPKGILRLTP